MDKRAALIAEGLSEGEADYMTSGGSNADGLMPPDQSSYAGDADDRPGDQAGAQGGNQTGNQAPGQAGAQPGVQGQPQPQGQDQDDPDNPAPPQNSPFYPQWQREKRRRQELTAQLRDTNEALTGERERWARLDERMRLFREAMEQPEPQAQPRPKPDRESDPFGYMAWLEEQLEGTRQSTEQLVTQQREQAAAAELTNAFRNEAAAYSRSNPDFWESQAGARDGAYHFLMRSRDAELQAAGYHDPNVRARIIATDERDIVAMAFQARQQNPRAPSPAEVLFNLAVSRGYQRRQAGAPPGGAPGGAADPGGARGPAAGGQPSVTQRVQDIQRGQQASRSLSTAGGAPVPQSIDIAAIADMTDTQYEAWKRSLTPVQRGEFYRAYLGR